MEVQPQLSASLLLTVVASSQSCFSELFLVSMTAGWEVAEGTCGASENVLRWRWSKTQQLKPSDTLTSSGDSGWLGWLLLWGIPTTSCSEESCLQLESPLLSRWRHMI